MRRPRHQSLVKLSQLLSRRNRGSEGCFLTSFGFPGGVGAWQQILPHASMVTRMSPRPVYPTVVFIKYVSSSFR